MVATLRSKVLIQQVRSFSGGKKMMEYFFQGNNDAVVKRMNNLQFKCGGWLEGTNQWGLIWRQTKVTNNLNSEMRCSPGQFHKFLTKD